MPREGREVIILQKREKEQNKSNIYIAFFITFSKMKSLFNKDDIGKRLMLEMHPTKKQAKGLKKMGLGDMGTGVVGKILELTEEYVLFKEQDYEVTPPSKKNKEFKIGIKEGIRRISYSVIKDYYVIS